MSLLPFPFPETGASLLEWRQNLIAQLYVATSALTSHELSSAELERLREQGSGLQWCALQQQVLAPGSMDETVTKHSPPPSSPSSSASSPPLPPPSSSVVESTCCPMRDTQMMVDSPPRHLPHKTTSYLPSPSSSPSCTFSSSSVPCTPPSRGDSPSPSPTSDAFFLKFRPLIEQLLAKAKVSVANYRWKPKRDPGDVAKLNNLTRGKVDQLVGLAEFIVGIWNNSETPPPFLIKPALAFSPRGHIYCVACKFTYVHLHKDYVKFIEHFTCVSHLARCRDMEDNPEGDPEELASNRENEAYLMNGGGGGRCGVSGVGGVVRYCSSDNGLLMKGGGEDVSASSSSPQQSLLHQFAQFVTQSDHAMLS